MWLLYQCYKGLYLHWYSLTHLFIHSLTYLLTYILTGVLVEMNTFLLIYRRNYGRNIFTEILFYITWVGIRIVLFSNILTKYAFTFIFKSINIFDFSIEFYSSIDIYTATFFVISLVLMVLNYYWTFDLLYKLSTDKNKTVSKGL